MEGLKGLNRDQLEQIVKIQEDTGESYLSHIPGMALFCKLEDGIIKITGRRNLKNGKLMNLPKEKMEKILKPYLD